jgi:hypothetical protein
MSCVGVSTRLGVSTAARTRRIRVYCLPGVPAVARLDSNDRSGRRRRRVSVEWRCGRHVVGVTDAQNEVTQPPIPDPVFVTREVVLFARHTGTEREITRRLRIRS